MSTTVTTVIEQVSSGQILSRAQEAAQKLWLFGLGAYALVTRSGVQAFDALVREGRAFKPKAQQQIEEKSAELLNSATATLERGEQMVRERLVRPLDYILLATRHDVEQLSLRVLQLSAEVHKLASGKSSTTARPPVKAIATPPESGAPTATEAGA